MLKRDPESFGSPRLGDEVQASCLVLREKKGLSGPSLARLGKCQLRLPLYAQDLVRFCSERRQIQKREIKTSLFRRLLALSEGERHLTLRPGTALLVRCTGPPELHKLQLLIETRSAY